MDYSFWRNRKVFLTGHTGFKGAWLTMWLRRMGAEVTGYSLPAPTDPSLFKLADVAAGIRSIEGDVRDLEHLKKSLIEAQPEVVLHLAAQALVRASYADPIQTFSSNIMGTVNMLEAGRACPSLRSMIIVTSDKCYENREWHWGYRENEAMGGRDPYSSSKGCAELVTAAFYSSFYQQTGNIGLASARAGNVIGGGDWAQDRLVPDLMRSFIAGKKTLIRNATSIRPWQHVLEPLSGYLELARHAFLKPAAVTGGWNFGPADSNAKPAGILADLLVQRWGGDAGWERDSAPQPHEANLLKLDSSKARNLLGWHARLNFGATLDWVSEWYKAFANGSDMKTVTERQIDQYMALPSLD